MWDTFVSPLRLKLVKAQELLCLKVTQKREPSEGVADDSVCSESPQRPLNELAG